MKAGGSRASEVWVFWSVDEAGEMVYVCVKIELVIDAHNCVPGWWLAL